MEMLKLYVMLELLPTLVKDHKHNHFLHGHTVYEYKWGALPAFNAYILLQWPCEN